MKSEWIPVKKRLPSTVHTVIITMIYRGRKVVSFGWYSPKNEAWNLLDDTYLCHKDHEDFTVLAWMECPGEYEEAT